MNSHRTMYNQKLLMKRLLRAAPFQRSGNRYRFGARAVSAASVERLIREGLAYRDGDLILPTAALERR